MIFENFSVNIKKNIYNYISDAFLKKNAIDFALWNTDFTLKYAEKKLHEVSLVPKTLSGEVKYR